MTAFGLNNHRAKPPACASQCPICASEGQFSFQSRDLFYNKTEHYTYMLCLNCGAIYQDPMPSIQAINSFYPEAYKVHARLEKPKQTSYLKRAVLRNKYRYLHLDIPLFFRFVAPFFSMIKYRNSIRFIPDGRALDIGCGNGKFMVVMNSIGWQFEGVELSLNAVKACRSVGLKVFHGDLKTAAYENNYFDLITARQLIEHIPDPNNLLREIVRILKKKGRLVMETPNSKALGRKWFGTRWYADDVPRHLVLFHTANLNRLAEQHGLRLVDTRMFTSPKIILNSWDYLRDNRKTPSKKRKLRRLIARVYVAMASLSKRGDIIFSTYEKP